MVAIVCNVSITYYAVGEAMYSKALVDSDALCRTAIGPNIQSLRTVISHVAFLDYNKSIATFYSIEC